MIYEKTTTIKVSKELTVALNLIGKKTETYEDIIWALLEMHRTCTCDAVLNFELRKRKAEE